MAKIIFITFALIAACFAEAPKPQEPSKNPEIQKIDARLAELAVIWKQDMAIINRLTNFKRTPVQQGSQAYNTCLQSSQRIQQAEAEAKTLKERKADLTMGTTPTDKTSAGDAPAAKEEAKRINNIPAVAYEKAKHGPKVKDLFIGMSVKEFADKASKLVDKPPKYETLSNGTIDASVGGHFGILCSSDEHGYLTYIIITGTASKKLFKAENLSLEQFVKLFEDGYGVKLQFQISGSLARYSTVTQEGIAISISQDLEVVISRGERPADTKKAFD